MVEALTVSSSVIRKIDRALVISSTISLYVCDAIFSHARSGHTGKSLLSTITS